MDDVPSEQPRPPEPERPDDPNLSEPDAILASLEADVDVTKSGHARAKKLKLVAELFAERGDHVASARYECLGALFDFMLQTRRGRRSGGYGRFAPMIEMNGKAYPHTDAFPPASLTIIKDAADKAKNPIHRALFADFIWDQRSKYPGASGEPYTAVTAAIDAYLEAAEIYRSNECDDQLADALDRAAELALSIRDAARIERCKRVCLTLAQQLVQANSHPAVRWAIDVLETLLSFERNLTDQEREEIVTLAQLGSAYYEAQSNHHLHRSYLEFLARAYNADGRPADADEARKRSARTFIEEANAADSAIVRLVMLQDAAKAYDKLGDSETLDTVKRELSQAGLDSRREMKTVSVKATIPTEIAEAWVRQLSDLNLSEALRMLVATNRFVPAVAEVSERASESRAQFPMQHLMARKTLDSAGRIVRSPNTDEEHVTSSETDAFNSEMMFRGWELGLAFARLEADCGLTQVTLLDHLRSSNVFEAATLAVVSLGIDRYFAEDYVSAVHVLVPQLEDALRTLLPSVGKARTSIQQGVTREKPLDIVLKTPELRALLGEDVANFMQRFLGEPGSANLRNRTGHGLIKMADCTRVVTQQVLLCYLYLANLAPLPVPPASTQEGQV